MTPLDYSLCCQAVTVYGVREGNVKRQVLENCYFAPETGQKISLPGKSRLKKFLLIIPGEADLQPGDRVYDGTGPETVQWSGFLPDTEALVYEIGAVKSCFWGGELCHIRAKEAL